MTNLKAELEALVQELAADLRESVADIEASKPATKNHYGAYMSIFAGLRGMTVDRAKVVAMALVTAGGNKQGVYDAFVATYGVQS